MTASRSSTNPSLVFEKQNLEVFFKFTITKSIHHSTGCLFQHAILYRPQNPFCIAAKRTKKVREIVASCQKS